LRRGIGYVFKTRDYFSLEPWRKSVALVPHLGAGRRTRFGARVAEMLELVGSRSRANLQPRRPALNFQAARNSAYGVARALAAEPSHSAARDEPFGALDPVTRADLQKEFRALAFPPAKDDCFRHAPMCAKLYIWGGAHALLAEGAPAG